MPDEKKETLSKLCVRLRSLTPKGQTLLIGIDGGGASGKTTFAEELAGELSKDVRIVHFDDFYKPTAEQTSAEWGENFDWQRLRDDVLTSLSQGNPAKY